MHPRLMRIIQITHMGLIAIFLLLEHFQLDLQVRIDPLRALQGVQHFKQFEADELIADAITVLREIILSYFNRYK